MRWSLAMVVACSTPPSPAAVAPAPEVAPAPASLEPVEKKGFVIHELPVIGGRALKDRLVEEAALAKARGLVPFAMVHGDFCDACRSLKASFDEPRMTEAFRGTFIVRLDTAVWAYELQQGLWIGEKVNVPLFAVLQPDGTFGAQLDGDAWGPNIPEEMAPPLAQFFRAWGAAPP